VPAEHLDPRDHEHRRAEDNPERRPRQLLPRRCAREPSLDRLQLGFDQGELGACLLDLAERESGFHRTCARPSASARRGPLRRPKQELSEVVIDRQEVGGNLLQRGDDPLLILLRFRHVVDGHGRCAFELCVRSRF